MTSPHGPGFNAPPPPPQGGNQVPPPNLNPIPGYGNQLLPPAPGQLAPGNPWGPPSENFKPDQLSSVGYNPIRSNTTGHDDIRTFLGHVAEEKAEDPHRLPGHEGLIAPWRKMADLGHVAIQGTHRWGENVGQQASARRRVASVAGMILLAPVAGVMAPLSGLGMLIRQKTNKNRNIANPWTTRAVLRRGEGEHRAAVLPDPNNPAYPTSSQQRLRQPLQQPLPYQGGNPNPNQQQPQPTSRRRRQQPY